MLLVMNETHSPMKCYLIISILSGEVVLPVSECFW